MVTIVLLVVSVICLIYGALIYRGSHTPNIAKVATKEGHLDAWCQTEGVARMLLGIDVSFLAVYTAGLGIVSTIGLVIFIAMAVYISMIRYNNNQKHFKR